MEGPVSDYIVHHPNYRTACGIFSEKVISKLSNLLFNSLGNNNANTIFLMNQLFGIIKTYCHSIVCILGKETKKRLIAFSFLIKLRSGGG